MVAAVVASEDPTEPLPGGAVTTVTVRYTPGPDVDGRRLERLVRDFVPAHLAVRCEAARDAIEYEQSSPVRRANMEGSSDAGG